MPYNWGPHYIVPTEIIKTYSGGVLLREEFDRDLLRKELDELGLAGAITKVANPWYYRRKNADTWIKIGESRDAQADFSVRWDTTGLENGQYEIMGLMHVFIQKGADERTVARENIVEVTVEN